jgi:hypothetical protein
MVGAGLLVRVFLQGDGIHAVARITMLATRARWPPRGEAVSGEATGAKSTLRVRLREIAMFSHGFWIISGPS